MEIYALAVPAGLALFATLAATLTATLAVWAAFFRTYFLLLAYLVVLFISSQNAFGSATQYYIPIYNRGAGILFFSWLIWVLWILVAVTVVRDKLLRIPAPECSMRPWIFGFVFLFLAHGTVGTALGISAKQSLSGQGVIHLANMGLLILLMLRTVDSRKALELLIWCALIAIAARDLFGLGRYFFFGGDPFNPYDNSFYAPGAKMTFFDINESLLACAAAAYCGFRLLHDGASLSRREKLFFTCVILLGVATAALSLRRTAWGGMALVSALVVFLAPAGKRLAVSIPVGAVLVAGLAVLFFKRLAVAWQHAQVGWGALYYDLVGGAHYGQASLRTLELQLGWEAFLDSPIFGQGPWGKFAAFSGFGEDWHGGEGAFGFVHSGVIHILFKTGLVGFTLLCGLLISFLVFARRAYRILDARERAVFVMGAAGLMFMLPDLFFGPGFTEQRTTQLMGFCFALPYLAYRVARAAQKKPS